MHGQSNRALARRVHGVRGLSKRLNDEQKAEVVAALTQTLGAPPQGMNDRDRVLWLLVGNTPPICRGADELAEGVRLVLVISERFQRGEFDSASAEDLGKVNPFHEVARTLRAWLPGPCVDPEKTKPDGETSGSDGSV